MGVRDLQASHRAFAALRSDGRVVTWGDVGFGGDTSGMEDELCNVQQVQSSRRAFAAVRSDGSVVTWGDSDNGGDSLAVQDQLQNVQFVSATEHAFAAVKSDGTVVSWGRASAGGDSSHVQDRMLPSRNWGPAVIIFMPPNAPQDKAFPNPGANQDTRRIVVSWLSGETLICGAYIHHRWLHQSIGNTLH